jgi:tetratricopeptide (TPR) repeat protein
MRLKTIASLIPAILLIASAQDVPTVNQPDVPPDVDTFVKSARADYIRGDYVSARATAEQAWKAIEMSPPSDPKRYDVAKLLESVLAASGEYKAAQESEELAINWRENNIGQNDPKIADELIESGTLARRLKEYDRAIFIFQRAMSLHVRDHGRESLWVADDWSRIALVYAQQQEKMEQAIFPLTLAIQTREAVMAAEHPAILPELDRLASLRVTLRHYPEAEETYRRAMVIRERLAGKMSADLIATVEGIAYAQYGQKKWDDAEVNYQRLLNLWVSATQEPNHPMIALTLDKMAAFYRVQKKEDQARESIEKAISIRQSFLATSLWNEAAERKIRGQKDEAMAMLERARGVIDPSRPEQADLGRLIEKDIAELNAPDTATPVEMLVESNKPQPTKPSTTKSTTTKATTTKP